MVYEYSGNGSDSELAMPLFSQLQVWLHTIVCPDCAQEIERFEVTKAIMREDFFPSSPALENTIMARITAEEEQEEDIETYAIPGGISTRGWVIAGLIILISMVTAFFGFDFRNVANESGISFMLPMGITIGCVLTTYGAFFIASHLKELSERFGL
jgi:hypothetical protein